MLQRRTLILAGLAAAALPGLAPRRALAHHGWRWTDNGEFELTGIVTAADLGNPHGVLTIDADGETWEAEVGQPWRSDRAGLTDEMMAPGAELTLQGHRDADPEARRMKAERVIIDGTLHDLYPGRA